jgi:phage tail tube protein FII
MSTTIDERVVEMRFDNRNFETNVKTSMSTLEKLKSSLNLKGASDGIANLGKVASKVTLDPMIKSVDAVQTKFSYFQATVQHQLNRIVDSAVDSGKRLVNAFTFEPLKTGFNEYELKMGSVQTIMASTGASLETVNKYLEELNVYSDKTIYSFSDMTQNIGKFTNAGVKLEDAVAAIKGVSNEAAVSGANAQEASRAMYNFAQALSAGYVKLIDWKSIENANMATVEFKQQLIDTALELGTVTKVGDKYKTTTTDANGKVSELFDATCNFNEALSNQWMTTNVLTQTLAKYADETTDIGKKAYAAAQDVKTFSMLMDTLKEAAQSGWAQTWELLVGDFEEAKSLFTEAASFFGSAIDNASKSRNNLLRGALDNVVSMADWKSLENAGKATEDFQNLLIAVAKDHNVAIDSMIEEEGNFANTLKNGWLTDDIYKEAISKLTDQEQKLIKQQVAGIESTKKRSKALKELSQAFKDADKPYTNLLSKLEQKSGRELLIDTLRNSIQAIIKPIQTVKEAWREVFPSVTSAQLRNIIEMLHEFSTKIIISDENANILKNTFVGVFKLFKSIIGVVKDGAVTAFDVINKLLGNFNFNIGETATYIGTTLSSVANWITKNVTLSNAIEKVGSVLQNGITFIKKWTKAVKDTVADCNFLQNAFEGISFFTQAVCKGFKKLGNIISSVAGPMISKIGEGFSNLFQGDTLGNGLDLLNSGVFTVGILSLKKVFDSISDALGASSESGGIFSNIKDILDGVRGSLENWQKNLQAKRLLSIASAVGILAFSLIAISGIDGNSLTRSLSGIGIMFAEMVAVMIVINNNIDNYKAIQKASTAMIAMSAALLLMAVAVKKLSSLDTNELTRGLIGVGTLAGMMTAVSVILSNKVSRITKGMTGMILFAAAIKILASACEDMSKLSWEDMGKGLAGVGSLMAEILLFTKLNKNSKGVIKTSVAMIALGASMKILASAMKDFSGMSLEELGRGLLAMGSALAELTIAMNLMPNGMALKGAGLVIVASSLLILANALSNFGSMSWDELGRGLTGLAASLLTLAVALRAMAGTAAGSAALLVAAGAIAILAPALMLLGNMSWESIAKGLVTLAGTFVILGASGLLLAPITPAILALSAAVGVLGVGILGVGAGVTLLATGLTMLAAGGVATVSSVMASLSIIIAGILGFIPLVVTQIGKAIITFAKVIGDGAKEIGEAVVKVVNAILDVLEGCVPRIVDVGLKLITELLKSIRDYIPEITTTAIDIVLAFIDAVASKLPDIIESGINLIVSFIGGIGDGLSSHSEELGESVRKLIYGIIDVTIEILTGAIGGILDIGKKWIVNGLIPGITSMSKKAKEAFKDLITKVKNSAKDKVSDFIDVGKNLISGVVKGIKSKLKDVADAAKSIGSKALKAIKDKLGIHSPSKKMAEVGAYAIDGFVKGLTTNSVKIKTVSNAVFSDFINLALDTVKVSETVKSTISSYTKTYLKKQKDVDKQRKTATKVLKAYANEVYKSSDYYKEDKKNLEDHLKQLKKYYTQKKELESKSSKTKNSDDKKSIQNSIKETTKNIKDLKKQINKDQKQIVKNAKKALKDVKDAIKSAVKDYVNMFNAASEEINLFGDSESTGTSGIKDSLSSLTSISNFDLSPGLNFLSEFSSSVEDLSESITTATDNLTSSKDELAEAEEELLVAQTKSLAVNGRSQKYLDEIAEAETKVAEAKEKVAEAQENLNNVTKQGSGTEMLENMKSNVDGFKTWKDNLDKLAKSGISNELMSYLRGLGISGAEQVAIFAEMTKDELTKANEYWEQYSSMSSQTLIDGMKDKSKEMVEWGNNIKKFAKLSIDDSVKSSLLQEFEAQGIDSSDYIKQILSMNATELNDFINSYKEMISIPEQVAAEVAKSIDSVNNKTDASKEIMNSYLDTMKANLEAEKEYDKNLKKLKKSGISDGLYEQIVASDDKTLVASFAKASESEIEEANAIFAESAKQTADRWLDSYSSNISDVKKWNENMKKLSKLDIPEKVRKNLYEEFEDKGMDGASLLDMILGFDDDQMDEFVKKYKSTGKLASSIADDVMAGSAFVSVETKEKMVDEAKQAAKETMNAMNKEIKAGKKKLTKSSESAGKATTTGLKKNMNKTISKKIGESVPDGAAEGIKEKSNKPVKAAKKMAEATLEIIKKTWNSHSPAKKFIELGRYADEGLAIGLTNYSYTSENAAESISEDVLGMMQNAITRAAQWANSGVDASPTIRPILDMSELQKQASSINGMFGSETIGVNANMASGIASRMNASLGSQNGSTTNNSYDQSTQTINNTFHVTGDNPKEIANEVSKILQKQVNRRSVTWA